MSTVVVRTPSIVAPVFPVEGFAVLQQHFQGFDVANLHYDDRAGRYLIADSDPVLREYHGKTLDLARRVFDSDTLLPSYALFARYQGQGAQLGRHKDMNACTYTLDVCVFQRHSWDLYVEDVPYTLHPNEAAAYYGNDQFHWREAFPEPETNHVAMIFFHYVEPDHWYFHPERRPK